MKRDVESSAGSQSDCEASLLGVPTGNACVKKRPSKRLKRRRRSKQTEVESSREDADSLDADADVLQNDLPPGPDSYTASFDWASNFLKVLAASSNIDAGDFASGFQARAPKKVVLTTTYSGMGCAEASCKFIVAALQQVFGVDVPIEFHSAMDNSGLCRKVLASMEFGPAHIFGDIYELITPQVKQELFRLQKVHIRRFLRARKAAQEGSKTALVHQHGQAFMRAACNALSRVVFRRDKKAWCYNCEGNCTISPGGAQPETGVLFIEVGGHTCTPWSLAGNRMSWLSSDAIPGLIWLHWIKTRNVHHFIDECSPNFDTDAIVEILKAYKVYPLVFSPCDLGLPSSRRRKYTHCIHGSLGLPLRQWDLANLRGLAFRQLNTHATMYFCAPEEELRDHCNTMARKRGLQRRYRWRYNTVMSVADRIRRDGYIQRATENGLLKKGTQEPHDGTDVIINVMQSSSHHRLLKPYAPALMRKSQLYSLKLKRGMLPLETLCVQGFPLWVGDEGVEALSCLSIDFLKTLKASELRSLTGNSMQLAAVGTAILFALCMSPALPQAAVSSS